MTDFQRLVLSRPNDHVLLIGLNRADKRNAFDLQMLNELGQAITLYEDDKALRW